MDDWFAVREQVSASHLRLRGYDVLLPCYREQRRWSDRIKTIDRPLFPGYLFSRIAPAVVAKLVSAPGVIRIVGDGSGPAAIPASEVEAIQRIVETNVRAEPWPFFRVGERVRVEDGPLRGAIGLVVSSDGRRRLVVSITLLQRSVAVSMDPAWISLPHPA
jgi:transcription antitermination factor NusG